MDYLLLGIVITCAGFIDSLAGGGGIITLPAYLIFGLNPALALGTNKLGSCMGTTISAWNFRDRLKISKKLLKVLAFMALAGAVIGALLTRLVDPKYLKFILLVVAPVMAYFVIASKKHNFEGTRRKIGVKKSNKAAKNISFGVAAYDGFLGPGAGTMYTVFLVKYAGFEILQATAIAKVLNLCSNLFSLAVFLFMGVVDIKLGFIMGCCSIIGHRLGVYVGKKHGAAVIRPLLVLVCIMIIGKVLWDYLH